MNELMNLDFEGTPVRVITADDGTPRWALADVCAACGIANPRNVAARLDDRQKGVVTMDTLGGPQKITVVNEDGLYDVILDSRKPEARRFRKWVTGEVLPSIRKHGAYMTPDTIRQALADPDTLIMLATRLKQETEEKVAAQERVRVLEPKARAYEDFCEAPDLLTVRDAAAQLTTAGLPIRECELRTWMLDHQWIYRHGGAYRPYAAHSTAGHLRLVPPKRSGRHRDGTPFPFDPTCKITRRGLCLLYQRIGAERVRDQLQYTDTQYPFDEEV